MAGFCTNCGTQRPVGARFCSRCGTAFVDAADGGEAEKVVAEPAVPIYPGVEEEDLPPPTLSQAAPSSAEATPQMPDMAPPPVDFAPQAVPFQADSPLPSSGEEAPSSRQPLLIGGLAAAAVLVAGLAWWAFSDIQVNGIQPKGDTGTDKAVVAAAPAIAADAPYVDDFLSQADEPMVTRGPVALLPLPGQSAGAPLRSMPENAPLTGRWVRGTDGTSRWFRVNGGGYLPEAAVITAQAAAPVVRPFDMNRAFATPLSSYFDAASREHRRAMELAQKKGGDEVGANGFATVPARPMFGLTVTGVGSHWEASTVMFRENTGAVAAALRRAGWQVSSDGEIGVGPDEGVTCSIGSTSQLPEFTPYGATVLSCGV